MAGHKSITTLLTSLPRTSPSSSSFQTLCRPCQHQLQLQTQLHHQPQTQTRSLHQHVKAAAVPKPTPFVPDVPTFLTLIGRKLSTHATKFQTWNDLFTLSSPQLKELGVEPARSRRYLLRWREKFRRGEYGIGGDFKHVSEGRGELRVVEVPTLKSASAGGAEHVSISRTPGMTKLIVNVPGGATTYRLEPGQTTKDLKKPAYVTLRDGHVIAGSYLQPVQGSHGSVAVLKVTEGLWEDKRGRKIFGGERRRAETLHKMRVEERKKNER